ncbi:hypothetical protein [Methylobacterium sp. J-076]|uniref:hypothetical protein n=1 Tax=Methylobacterium sp. J-076 TaxID=2836655 RepID=UPI001FB921B4|nr:hypothetical protein [Methylobacterium sp. J-076]MCJ2011796.1 hypothetical protein [Methylobacterium sp. J-076]
MSRPNQALFASVAITVFGLGMAGLHYLTTGFGEEFGAGVAVGGLIGMGLTFLASRQARETP